MVKYKEYKQSGVIQETGKELAVAFEDDALERMHAIMSGSHSAMMDHMNRVHRGEPAVMRELATQGACTPGHLAEVTRNSPGRISAILAALEKKGWATRTVDPNNRRRVIVRITPEGRKLVAFHRQMREERLRWIFGQMGERGTAEFLDLLAQFMVYTSLCGPDAQAPDEAAIAKAFEDNGLQYRPAEDRENIKLTAARPEEYPFADTGTAADTATPADQDAAAPASASTRE